MTVFINFTDGIIRFAYPIIHFIDVFGTIYDSICRKRYHIIELRGAIRIHAIIPIHSEN